MTTETKWLVPKRYEVRPCSFADDKGWREVSKREFDDYDNYHGYPKEEWERRVLYSAEQVAQLQARADACISIIDEIRDKLHTRRCTDWYPEGANSAALQMSDDMRLLGNYCAEFLDLVIANNKTKES